MIRLEKMPDAYMEVEIILKYVNKNDVKLIPNDFIQLINEKKNEDHLFEYNTEEPLEKQKILRETKAILTYIFVNYWATKEQQQKILLKFEHDKRIHEEKIKELYNTEKLFKNKKRYINEENQFINLPIEYQKNKWYEKIISKIKKIFKKK